MEKLYVPYEIALALKEKGFNGTVINSKYYHIHYKTLHDYSFFGHFDNMLNAPIYQEVKDWLREEHDINVMYVVCGSPTTLIGYKWFVQVGMEEDCFQNKIDDYYIGMNKAILKALELIKK